MKYSVEMQVGYYTDDDTYYGPYKEVARVDAETPDGALSKAESALQKAKATLHEPDNMTDGIILSIRDSDGTLLFDHALGALVNEVRRATTKRKSTTKVGGIPDLILVGSEEVSDAFDDYEHSNYIELRVSGLLLPEAIVRGHSLLQEMVTEQRRAGGFLTSGSFAARLEKITDGNGRAVYLEKNSFAELVRLDVVASYARMLQRIKALEAALSDLRKPGIGHNHPPEPLTDVDHLAIAEAVGVVKTQTAKPADKPKNTIAAAEELLSLSSKIFAYLRQKGDIFVTEAAKGAGQEFGKWAIRFLVLGALAAALSEAYQAIMAWVHSL